MKNITKIISSLVIVLLFLFAFSFDSGACAQTSSSFRLYSTERFALSTEAVIKEGHYVDFSSGKYLIPSEAAAVVIGEADDSVIDAASGTVLLFTQDEAVYLEEGIIGISAYCDATVITTRTETVNIAEDSRFIIKVDDYGNAFNYCIKGSAVLKCIKTGDEVTLHAGEYIAITVKGNLRKLRTHTENEINELGVSFTSIDTLAHYTQQTESVIKFENDFSEEGVLAETPSNSVYFITGTGEFGYSQVLYLSSENGDANTGKIVLYDHEFNFIAQSDNKLGTLKPNVRVQGEKNTSFYVCVYGPTDTSFSLCNSRYISIYEKSFELFKKLIPLVLLVLVVFVIYSLISSKFLKKPKF